tara:strand:+ start:1148 stop:1303 length:156 start_codon:yes stop_codon:yes gene_type:complete
MNDKNNKTTTRTARPSGAFNLGVTVGDKDNWRSRNNAKPLVTRKATIPSVR